MCILFLLLLIIPQVIIKTLVNDSKIVADLNVATANSVDVKNNVISLKILNAQIVRP